MSGRITVFISLLLVSYASADMKLTQYADCASGSVHVGAYISPDRPAGDTSLALFYWTGPDQAVAGIGWLTPQQLQVPGYWGISSIPSSNCKLTIQNQTSIPSPNDGELFPFTMQAYFIEGSQMPQSPAELQAMIQNGSAMPVQFRGICVRQANSCSEIIATQRVVVPAPPGDESRGVSLPTVD